MSDRPLIVLAPRMLLVRNRRTLQNHLLERFEEGRRDLVVSFEQTHYVDSSGLGMLAGLHRRLVREGGGALRICGLNADLATLFAVTRLDATVKVVACVEGELDPWRMPEDRGAAPAFASAP
jgi:anti-sigma B factor antagonist